MSGNKVKWCCLFLSILAIINCKHLKKSKKSPSFIDKKQVLIDNNYPYYETGYPDSSSLYNNNGEGKVPTLLSPPSKDQLAIPQPLLIPEDDFNVLDRIMRVNDQKGLYYDEQNPNAPPKAELFEGDIVRSPHLAALVAEMKDMGKKGMKSFDAINGGQWPSATIPYTFAYGFGGVSVVLQAIEEFKKHTCIKFRPKTASDRDYVEFMHGGGCSSMIGRQGGMQQISLASGCLIVGIAVHEMMHAVGFFHEQSRLDRDDYIRINWNNINPAMWYNFQKYRDGHASTLGEPYDKKSVMHYGNYAFSINGQKAIESISNYNEVLGQRDGMSEIDKKQLNKYYQCTTTTKPEGGGNKKDKHPFCVDIGSWCSKDDYVLKNCEKTCCTDLNSSCKYWSTLGYCNGKGYDEWMEKNCAESCGYC